MACDEADINKIMRNLKRFDYLRKKNVSPSVKIKQRNFLLFYAVKNNWTDIVKQLVDSGADVNVRDAASRTILHIAAEKNNLTLVKQLLEYGADVHAADLQNRTALHFAVIDRCRERTLATRLKALSDKLEIVELLLEHGADVNVRMKNTGATPLHLCAYRGYHHIINLLLQRDVDVDIIDYQNRTPLQYAIEYVHHFDDIYCPEHEYDRFVIDARVQTFRHLQEHVHKMHAVGMTVAPENFFAKDIYYNLDPRFEETCNLEVKQLDITYIGTSAITYKDFLSRSVDDVAKFLRDPVILKALFTSSEVMEKFIGYKYLIHHRFKQALAQRYLDDRSATLLDHFFSNLSLDTKVPLDCIERILGFLNLKEKENIVNNFYESKIGIQDLEVKLKNQCKISDNKEVDE